MIHNSIKFVFWGTPELSVEILERLKKASLAPSLVVTNPDRPQGRKMILTPPPVKVWAIKNNIQFLQPENLSDLDFVSQLSIVNCQLFIIVAYGKIIPKKILDISEKGALNIHYSLLPKYRGASPIESAILNDDRNTGVSILLLDEKMDHGPIVAEQRLEIRNNLEIQDSNIQTPTQLEWPPRASELRKTMNKLAGELLVKTVPTWIAGKIKPKEQNHSQATYTKKLSKADGEINLADDPYKNFLKIRAFEDSIGTYFYTEPTRNKNMEQKRKIRVLIKDAEFQDEKLILTRVLPEGKKEMSYEKFLKWVR